MLNYITILIYWQPRLFEINMLSHFIMLSYRYYFLLSILMELLAILKILFRSFLPILVLIAVVYFFYTIRATKTSTSIRDTLKDYGFGFVKKDFEHLGNTKKFHFYRLGLSRSIKNIHFGSYKGYEIKLFDLTVFFWSFPIYKKNFTD